MPGRCHSRSQAFVAAMRAVAVVVAVTVALPPSAAVAEPPALSRPVAPSLAAYLARASAYALPAPIPRERAIRDTIRLHEANGGATFSLYFGDQSGQPLYAVALFPDLSRRIPGRRVPPAALRAYMAHNGALLADPRCSVGTWFDAARGETWLDVAATLPGRTQAVCLGRRYNQRSIFDLARMQEIETGGTGAAVRALPPAARRLPRLRTTPAAAGAPHRAGPPRVTAW